MSRPLRHSGALALALAPNMMRSNLNDPHEDPPDWEKDMGYNRAHLLGAQLSGSNYATAASGSPSKEHGKHRAHELGLHPNKKRGT
ncbi:hypothetical protein ACIRP3_01235 [Streptomyces sp. NPDC101209]|uniref:hypothetical protein n=1 Tax=Streptomyces sp. NPDC101209 TaxID=3366129 RepID=UPI003820964E